MKCEKCEKEAKWFNPYTKKYYCDYHAKIKFDELKEELNIDIDTLKDIFCRIIKLHDGSYNV